jgi:hypothetical protein
VNKSIGDLSARIGAGFGDLKSQIAESIGDHETMITESIGDLKAEIKPIVWQVRVLLTGALSSYPEGKPAKEKRK